MLSFARWVHDLEETKQKDFDNVEVCALEDDGEDIDFLMNKFVGFLFALTYPKDVIKNALRKAADQLEDSESRDQRCEYSYSSAIHSPIFKNKNGGRII